MIKIDKCIPLPMQTYAKRGSKYPLTKMKPGDSFFVPLANQFYYAKQTASKLKIKVAGRKVLNGFRIWRIA